MAAGKIGRPLTVWSAWQALQQDGRLLARLERVLLRAGGLKDAAARLAEARVRCGEEAELAPLVALLDGLAEVMGPDGTLQASERAALPVAVQDALALLERRAATVKAAPNGIYDAADHFIEGTVYAEAPEHVNELPPFNPVTLEQLFSTSESLVGLVSMPVLQKLAEEAAKTQPLKGMQLVAVQHLFPSTVGLFEALKAAGIRPEDAQVLGKTYSSNPEVCDYLEAEGWAVTPEYDAYAPDASDPAAPLEFPLLEALKAALARAKAKTPPEKVLLLDEGGKLNKLLHELLPEDAALCVVVEQTTNGLQNMEGIELLCPGVAVAASELKREVEGPIIGEDVAATTLETLERVNPRLAKDKVIGIVGYGAVGRATAEAFARRGYRVIITDIDPEKEALAAEDAKKNPLISVAPRSAVIGAGIVVGCTGRGAITPEELEQLSDGAILVNAASGDHEFPLLQTGAAREQGARAPTPPMSLWKELLESGYDWTRGPGMAEFVRKVRQGYRPDIKNLRGTIDERLWVGGKAPPNAPRPAGKTFAFPASGGDVQIPRAKDPNDPLPELYFEKNGKRFTLLRGGTPINMDRDLPPGVIQLTRAMLFMGILQAAGESGRGWKTFDPAAQTRIETAWREEQPHSGPT